MLTSYQLSRLLIVLVLLLPAPSLATRSKVSHTPSAHIDVAHLVPQPVKPDFDKEVLAPLRQAQAIEAARVAEVARVAAVAEAARLEAVQAASNRAASAYIRYAPSVVQTGAGTLQGAIGYVIAGGNCVNQISPSVRPNGNPETWAATTMTPYIGAAALFPYNHVGRVVGIWSNGDVELANENWNGVAVTRFPQSELRGYR